jgi:hypothetical protein
MANSFGMLELEDELIGQHETESLFETEDEFEAESPEAFGLSDIGNWAKNTWRDINTKGTTARKVVLDMDRAAIAGSSGLLGGELGALVGPAGIPIGGAIGTVAGTGLADALIPDSAYELNPIRRWYPDAMMEHLAHEAAEAESETEAAEQFLPLIPLVAGKLLPLAAKVLPKIAGKVLPKLANAVSKVAPKLTRGISNITRTLFRKPQTRPLIRVVPSIARRTVTQIARQAVAGRSVSPQMAQQVLRAQVRRVVANPQAVQAALRRSAVLDSRLHQAAGLPRPVLIAPPAACACGRRTGMSTAVVVRPAPRVCRCCGQLVKV